MIRITSRYALAAAAALLFGSDANAKPNVLLIAVDDLRPNLGCFGDTKVQSPNIDALASRGRLFLRAYCQQAVCNPSRTSLMTGLRPDTIGVTGNHIHFRTNKPDVVTLSQHFIQHGYHAQSIGKIYHGFLPDGTSKTKWDTMGDRPSWSVPAIRFGPRYYYTEPGIQQARQAYRNMYRPRDPGPNDWTQKLVFGPMTEAPEVADETLHDGKVAAKAIETLERLKHSETPFFLAVGFIKPHTPFVAPKRYWDLYDPNQFQIAKRTTLPDGAPEFSGHRSGEIRRYTDQPNRGDIPPANQLRMRHGYYACISYIDAQLGKVLDALDSTGLADNTIVALFGDHGYHLGEHGLWGKTTNFELDTHVPLIIRAPGMQHAGTPTRALAELVDLYPTLADLTGLPIAGELEGTSLSPVITDPTASPDNHAISQFPRGKRMGYSLRTDRWRYTEWIDQRSGMGVAHELYDHQRDTTPETINVAEAHPQLVSQLSTQLRNEIGLDEPTASSNTGFESLNVGPVRESSDSVGRWNAESGHAVISRSHCRSGRQCLHMSGGADRQVELMINQPASDSTLEFYAERWTKHRPFRFRIERSVDGQRWKEIYNGDETIRVGGFLTKVKVRLPEGTQHLRFTASSPSRAGVMIDDLSIVPPTPQRIVGITVEPIQVPILIGLKQNPLLRIRIDTEGSRQPISVTSVVTSTTGTIEGDEITQIELFSADDMTKRSEAARAFGKPQTGIGRHRFGGNLTLQHGVNDLWLSCQLDNDTDIDHVIAAACQSVGFSDGTNIQPHTPEHTHRLGVALRQHRQQGIHTYRIPGLATTNNGTLIGVYDLRYRSSSDLPGNIDVGMTRSTDDGRTWEPDRVIMDMGDDKQWRYDGIGDPAILVDRTTGTIWVAATWSHGNRSWTGSGPGIEPDQTGQLMLVRSDDDGLTWSDPINITAQVKRPEWCFLLAGPGKGITMRDGTIVFAAQYQDAESNQRLPHSTIIYSRDHGVSWQIGTGAFDDTTEAQVVESEPGVLMLNCRYNRANTRVVMTTRDLGKTWHKHSSSEQALIEPKSCMASLIDVGRETGRQVGKGVGNWLLFSNPDSQERRRRIMIKASSDRGQHWPKQNRLLLDEGTGRGYSCMSMIDRATIGILYESSRADMVFQRIPLNAVIDSPNALDEPDAPEAPDAQEARTKPSLSTAR